MKIKQLVILAGLVVTASCNYKSRRRRIEVLHSLREQANKYGAVSISEYNDLIGVESVYTDCAYGWTTELLKDARIVATLRGWVLDLPQTEVII